MHAEEMQSVVQAPEGECTDMEGLAVSAFAALELADCLYSRLVEAKERGGRITISELQRAPKQAAYARVRLGLLIESVAERSAMLDAALFDYNASWLATASAAGVA